MKNVTLASLLAFLSLQASAALLTLNPGGTSVEGVNVSKGGVLSSPDSTGIEQKSEVKTVGAGLRSKKVLISNVKVYVAQLLVSAEAADQLKADHSLTALQKSSKTAMTMTFLRNVEAAKVQVSFEDALRANNADLANPVLAQFLNAVATGGDALKDKSLTVSVMRNADGSETLSYEDANGKTTHILGSAGLTEVIMSIWLGQPADSGIESLKNQLLKSL